MRKIILDCDPGVDDTMALMYAALHPEIDLIGVGTVWGNIDVQTGTRNAIHTLEMVGAGAVPVAVGAARPLHGGNFEYAPYIHGDDGQGNAFDGAPVGNPVATTAPQQLIELVKAHPGEAWIAAVGPLTNLAIALALEPDLPELVAGVAVMGGNALAPGNASPAAEANIWHDPAAAAAVFDADWPITMAGLDATMGVLITPERRAVLDAGGRAARYMSRILQLYGDFYASRYGSWNATMHDTIGVAAAAGTLTVRQAPVVDVRIDASGGPSHGATVCDMRGMYSGYPPQEGAHCTVLMEIDDLIADDVLALIAAYRGPGEQA